jgi:hypothetical protein
MTYKREAVRLNSESKLQWPIIPTTAHLGLGVRLNVVRSTETRPCRDVNPATHS